MKENFLIVYFYDDYFDVLGFKADFQNRKLEISLNKKGLILNQGNLKKIFTRAFYPGSYKIIFVFDSKRGFGSFESVAINRDNPEKSLSPVEFENLISQAVWKVFDSGRHEAAKRFNVGDLEKYEKEGIITRDAIIKRARDKKKMVKILGSGEVKKAIIVIGIKTSKSAEAKIKKAGGKIK